LRKPPSFVLAASEEDAELDTTDFGVVHEGVGPDADGDSVASLRPAWCPVFTAEHNSRLRMRLDRVLQAGGEFFTDGTSKGATDPSRAMDAAAASKWGRADMLWHKELTHDCILVEVLLRLGLAYSSLGRFAHAAQLLRKALLRVEEMTQQGMCAGLSAEGMRAELLGTLSSVLCQQGLWQDAEAMLWQARQLAKHAGHEELHTRLTCDLAEFNHKYMGNLRCAAQFFKDGLSQRMKTLGLDHLDTAATLNAVGVFCAQRGHFRDAREYITQAARIRRKLLGPSHISVAEALHNLAGVHESLQDFVQAEQCYEHALQIKQKVLPESHMSIADTQNNLSVLYSKTKKHEQCVGLLRRCLEQCLLTVGEDNASTASVLMNLGHALHSLATANHADSSLSAYVAQLDEAKGLLERAFRVRRALFHRHHPCIAPCRANLGYVHYKKGEFDIAERHFSAALRICRHHYGGMHPDVACWLYWLGKTHCRSGRTIEGRENLGAALQISELLSGDVERGGQNPFTSEQLADLRSLLDGHPMTPAGPGCRAADEMSSCESTFEPAEEPPSAELLEEAPPPRRRRAAEAVLNRKMRPRELSLDLGAESEADALGGGWCHVPPVAGGTLDHDRAPPASPSSSSGGSGDPTRNPSFGSTCRGCAPLNEPEYAQIIQHVRQSYRDYATAQQQEGI